MRWLGRSASGSDVELGCRVAELGRRVCDRALACAQSQNLAGSDDALECARHLRQQLDRRRQIALPEELAPTVAVDDSDHAPLNADRQQSARLRVSTAQRFDERPIFSLAL